jgi:hypothetical protein
MPSAIVASKNVISEVSGSPESMRLRLNGLSYSKFIFGLKKPISRLDRKVLADIAVSDPAGFAQIATLAKAGILALIVVVSYKEWDQPLFPFVEINIFRRKGNQLCGSSLNN